MRQRMRGGGSASAELHFLTGLRRPAAALIALAWPNGEIATGGQLASELIRIHISHSLKERTTTRNQFTEKKYAIKVPLKCKCAPKILYQMHLYILKRCI